VDIRVRIRVLKRPLGGPIYAYLVVRGTDGHEYRPKLVFRPDGTVAVHAGLVVNGVERPLGRAVTVATRYPVRQFFWLRARVRGTNPTTISIRAWTGGQPEPDAWQLTLTDSHAPVQRPGFLGLRANLSSRASNAPATVEFDDFRALPLS
jgi:hypothetical protein